MKKSEFKTGVQFTSNTITSSKVYTVACSYNDKAKKPSRVETKLITSNGLEINDNQYVFEKITDNYLYLYDFVISEKISIRIPLKNIKLINNKTI